MFSVTASNFADIIDDIEGDVAEAATEAMRDASRDTVLELRDQVRAAGLGNRLANTWRGETYPSGRNSLNPAGYIWSNAPDIIDAFERGATIRPLAGKRFLWIPTQNVPRAAGRRGSTKLMDPLQVEIAFNQDLFFRRGKSGRVLAFVNAIGARNGRGFRRATAGRVAQGRQAKPILMFTLVPTVRLPKLLDLPGTADRGASRFERRLRERLGQ